MDIINEYLMFKKNYLLEYADILLPNMSTYEKELIDTFMSIYINSYYLHKFETIDTDKEYITLKEVREEIKGKQLEILYELTDNNKEFESIIKRVYKVAILICVIDIKKYEDANVIDDYAIVLDDLFFKNAKGLEYDTNMINKLSRLVKKNRVKTNKYLNEAKSDVFSIKTIIYRGFSDRYMAKMLYKIPTLKDYKENILENIYNNENLYMEKLITKIKLLNAIILEKNIKRDKCGYYFIELPLNYLKKEDMDIIHNLVNNELSMQHLVFILDYQLYKQKDHLFNKEDPVKYACLINFARVRDVNIKLLELENNNLFNFIIIDDVKTEDRKTILNYDMPGKEIFENIYDFNESEV